MPETNHERNAMIATYLTYYHSFPLGKKRPQEVEDTHPVLDKAFRLLSFGDRALALKVVEMVANTGVKITPKGLSKAVKYAEDIIKKSKTLIASAILITLFSLTALPPPASAQLAPPMPGSFAQPPLVYYRVAFISKGKKLDKASVDVLVASTVDDPISEKYIIKAHKNDDGTYEVEMRMRIIFFDKKEAEKSMEYLRANPAFSEDKFQLLVVQEDQL